MKLTECFLCHQRFLLGDKFVVFECSDKHCGDHPYHVECYLGQLDTEERKSLRQQIAANPDEVLMTFNGSFDG